MFKSNMITRARAKNTPTKRKKVTKKDVEVTNTLLLLRSEPSALRQPLVSALKVAHLKELIKSEGVPMPLLGSGVNNRIVKKDMIQAVLNFYQKQIKTEDTGEPDKVNIRVVNIKRKNPVKSSANFSSHRQTKKAPPSPKRKNPVKSSGKKKVLPSPKRKNPVKSSGKKKAPPIPKKKEVHLKKAGCRAVQIEFTIEMKDRRLKGKIEEFIQQYHQKTGNKGNEYIVGTQIHYSVQEKGYFVCISNTEVGMDPLCWISENYDLYRPRSSFKVGNINRKEYIFVRGNVASYYDVGIHTQQRVTRANRKKK